MESTLLSLGGLFILGFSIFHIFFEKIFRWKSDLQSLTYLNRQIMYLLNWCLTLIFVAFAYLSLFWQKELLDTSLGHFLIGFIAFFWFFRLVLQFVCFGFKNLKSNLFALLIAIGTCIYTLLYFSVPDL